MPTFEQEQAARKAHVLAHLAGPRPTDEACRCGREMRMLSIASPRPTCAGCGYPSDLCTCQPLGEQRWPWYRVHPELGDHPDGGTAS